MQEIFNCMHAADDPATTIASDCGCAVCRLAGVLGHLLEEYLHHEMR